MALVTASVTDLVILLVSSPSFFTIFYLLEKPEHLLHCLSIFFILYLLP